MLAGMGAAFDLEPQAPYSRETLVLKDLHVARTRLRNRAQTQDIAVLKRQTKAPLAQVECQIAELDTEIAALIAAGQTTARNRDILCSMPGIGTVTTAAMLTLSQKSARLNANKWQASLASRPSHASLVNGRARHSLGAGANRCVMPYTCRRWLLCGATRTSKPNTNNCLRQENPPKSQSSLSCASASKWQMLSSKLIASGSQKPLDQDGYSTISSFPSQPWAARRRCRL
jgi:hypothetical protein